MAGKDYLLTVLAGLLRELRVCIVRRMPRMQVYLPDDLYEQVKTRHMPASELLQKAVRAEVRRQDLQAETDAYLAELVAEVGEPSPEEQSHAEAIARRIASGRAARAS
jgi:post-segregation antitoxin (ccd killing protein)